MPASLKHLVGSLRAPTDERGDVASSGRRRRPRALARLGAAALVATMLGPVPGASADAVTEVALPTSFAASDLPVVAVEFRRILRAYVAGDVEAVDITRMADEYPLEWRVIGDVPGGCRYRGQPVLAHRTRGARVRP